VSDELQKRARTKWLRGLADRFAYEDAKRIEVRELVVAETSVLIAVYVTQDPVDFVDYWYRQRLELGGNTGLTDISVRYGVDGRRWSFFRDGCTFEKEPTIKRGPMTVRQIVFEEGGHRYVMLAVRPPGATLTQISLTVLPDEGPKQ
jgi:hypothetical protein